MTYEKPEELWAFWANRNGPWWKTPQKVVLHEGGFRYYHKNGNADVERQGMQEGVGGYMCFAHTDKKEVQKFIDGFMACRKLMAQFYVD